MGAERATEEDELRDERQGEAQKLSQAAGGVLAGWSDAGAILRRSPPGCTCERRLFTGHS